MLPVVWDMETQDPDDFLTLLFLLGHPQVDLRAVTVIPGTPEQMGFVRRAVLDWFGSTIPLGAYDPTSLKAALSPWHSAAYGSAPPWHEAAVGGELLLATCSPETTLITGAPLKNIGKALRLAAETERELQVNAMVIQGGFAGEGLVQPEKQLPQFAGRVTCPSFNLNGDPRTALLVQNAPGIPLRRFVSKNVCHGVIYDRAVHALVAEVKQHNLGLRFIWQGMERYLQQRPEGKAIHDLLAACCAIDPTIGVWEEVEVYREHGAWGARRSTGSGTWIIVDYDRERFLATLLAY